MGRAAGAQARLAAIPAPINMLNLQAPGFARTMWARMVQAERHARGCADFAYALKHARAMPAFSWTTVALCLKVRGKRAGARARRAAQGALLGRRRHACSPRTALVLCALLCHAGPCICTLGRRLSLMACLFVNWGFHDQGLTSESGLVVERALPGWGSEVASAAWCAADELAPSVAARSKRLAAARCKSARCLRAGAGGADAARHGALLHGYSCGLGGAGRRLRTPHRCACAHSLPHSTAGAQELLLQANNVQGKWAGTRSKDVWCSLPDCFCNFFR